MIKLLLLSSLLLLLAMGAMALNIWAKRGGRFPDGHISHNKALKKKGIVCAKTWDRQEQLKGKPGNSPAFLATPRPSGATRDWRNLRPIQHKKPV